MKLKEEERKQRLFGWLLGNTAVGIKKLSKLELKAQQERARRAAAEKKKADGKADKLANAGIDEEHTGADAGSALWYPIQASALRKSGHVMIKGNACKIVDMSTSKTGKHGHAKIKMVALCVFTGTKYETLSPSTHNMDVPHVKRSEWMVLDISNDGFLSLMSNENNDTRNDIRLPGGPLGEEIKAKHAAQEQYVVSVLSALGREQVMAIKNLAK